MTEDGSLTPLTNVLVGGIISLLFFSVPILLVATEYNLNLPKDTLCLNLLCTVRLDVDTVQN